jgi:competence protein ComEC
MVRVSFFFIVGILSGIFLPELLSATCAIYIAASLSAIYFGLWFIRTRWAKALRGFTGLSAVLVIGLFAVHRSTDSTREDHLLHVKAPIRAFAAVVVRYGEEKDQSWRYEADVTRVKTDSGWQTVKGRILLYVSKTGMTNTLKYGDVLLIDRSPEVIPSPSNPGEFDLKTYQRYRKIYHRSFVQSSSIKFLQHDPPSNFIALAINMRAWATAKLKEAVTTPREQATITALVLGVTDGLDDELLKAYSATGAMHVLAVSGLHVSIIYWLILLMFKPLDKTASGKWILAIGSIILLWAYAFVTGWSPSVLRAVMMFTFVALSRPWKQSTMIYNTLAASAFCLLLYEPYFIMSVGFQLSYLAVLGIVWLQRPLYALWEPRGRFTDECWKVTSVSIAAQVTTLPLTLFSFHQFPVYFLIANLAVIPASFVVLVGGLALLPMSFIPIAAKYFGIVMEWMVRVMNEAIFITEGLPFSKIDGIFIDGIQALILIVMIVAFCLVFLQKKFYFLVITAVSTSMFVVLQWQRYMQTVNRNEFVVYDVRKHTAIDWIRSGVIIPLRDSALQSQSSLVNFHQTPYRLIAGGETIVRGCAPSKAFDGLMLVVVDGFSVMNIHRRNARLPRSAKVNCVIVSNNSVKSLQPVVNRVKCDLVVIDSSNSFYFAEELTRQARALGINVWSVPHSGALIRTIKE